MHVKVGGKRRVKWVLSFLDVTKLGKSERKLPTSWEQQFKRIRAEFVLAIEQDAIRKQLSTKQARN